MVMSMPDAASLLITCFKSSRVRFASDLPSIVTPGILVLWDALHECFPFEWLGKDCALLCLSNCLEPAGITFVAEDLPQSLQNLLKNCLDWRVYWNCDLLGFCLDWCLYWKLWFARIVIVSTSSYVVPLKADLKANSYPRFLNFADWKCCHLQSRTWEGRTFDFLTNHLGMNEAYRRSCGLSLHTKSSMVLTLQM